MMKTPRGVYQLSGRWSISSDNKGQMKCFDGIGKLGQFSSTSTPSSSSFVVFIDNDLIDILTFAGSLKSTSIRSRHAIWTT